MSIRATATIRLTLEVTTADCWGEDCTTGQVFEQAAQSAIDRVSQALRIADVERGIRIVGAPEVTAVAFRKEAKP